MDTQKKRAVFSRVLAVLGGFLLAAVLYVAVVMGTPTDVTVPAEQPLLTAEPEQTIAQVSELEELVRRFPSPVLLSMSSAGLTMEGAHAADLPLSGGFGRRLTISYLDADGTRMLVESVYPASAESVLTGGGYQFSGISGHSVAGQRTIRMETKDSIRLHFATEKGLYTITVPSSASKKIAALVRSLSLLSLK